MRCNELDTVVAVVGPTG